MDGGQESLDTVNISKCFPPDRLMKGWTVLIHPCRPRCSMYAPRWSMNVCWVQLASACSDALVRKSQGRRDPWSLCPNIYTLIAVYFECKTITTTISLSSQTNPTLSPTRTETKQPKPKLSFNLCASSITYMLPGIDVAHWSAWAAQKQPGLLGLSRKYIFSLTFLFILCISLCTS